MIPLQIKSLLPTIYIEVKIVKNKNILYSSKIFMRQYFKLPSDKIIM